MVIVGRFLVTNHITTFAESRINIGIVTFCIATRYAILKESLSSSKKIVAFYIKLAEKCFPELNGSNKDPN